jgi:hypothetical protein
MSTTTMKTLANTTLFDTSVTTPTTSNLVDRLRGLFRADRTDEGVEAFIQANGGVLTDQLEREISRRYGTMVGK